MGNKIYCHPFTITDSKSRFIFSAKGQYKKTLKNAKIKFNMVFRTYDIPRQTHTDKGNTFGSVGAI
tara:strand:+ start:103 stop:300 length:198 start_codon:yes stop_codon:yes gene_type:complete